MKPGRMAFIGVGGVTLKAQYQELVREGYRIVSAAEIRRRGALPAIEETIAELSSCCSALYLSIDIDVLDSAEAPGTGNVTFGGLRAGDLLDLALALRRIPLAAVDVVEVAPRYDASGRTPQIAARLLFELLYRATHG
jgi:arginase family enzyme